MDHESSSGTNLLTYLNSLPSLFEVKITLLCSLIDGSAEHQFYIFVYFRKTFSEIIFIFLMEKFSINSWVFLMDGSL